MDRFLPVLRRARLELLVPALLGVMVLAAIAAGGSPGKEQPPGTVAVQRGAVVATVSAEGSVEPPQELALDFEGFGRVAEVFVEEGDHVRRGQVLARIQNAPQRVQLGSAEANLTAARSRLDQTRTGLTAVELALRARQAAEARTAVGNAQRDLADARNSANANVAALRRAAARARVTGEQADLRAAELRLAQEQAKVEQLRHRYERAKANTEADREELYDQLDRLRDAQNQDPPDETQANDASFRIDVLRSKIEAEEVDEARVKSDLDIATANVRTYVQEVDGDRATLREARRRLGDVSDELRTGIASARQQVDQARAALSGSQAQLQTTLARNRVDQQVKAADVAASIANLSQAEALLEDAHKAIEDTVLRAPTTGVVGHVNAKVGELAGGALRPGAGLSGGQTAAAPAPGAAGAAGSADAAPSGPPAGGGASGAGAGAGFGAASGDPLITLVQTGGLQVEANFNETDAANLHTGDPATVTVDALPDRRLAARVASIDPVETIQNNVVTYKVTMVLDLAPTRVRPGMSATADVTVARRDDVLTLPRTAVRSPQGANPSVIVVRPDGRQEIRMVALGLQSASRVQILAGIGLGERVLRTISPPPQHAA
jgi:multidrug efflux pump subunit AcrA (membrane-fusion protein)